jgi:hypothetical protein
VDGIGNELLQALTVAPYEAVPLLSATAAEREVEARQKECDYVMSLELTALKSSVPGRIGRLTRRASGGGSPSELHEAKVEFRVSPAGAPAPRVAKSASAKTGAFTWKRALGVAKLAARLYFGASTGMARMLLQSNGRRAGRRPGRGSVHERCFIVVNLLDRAQTPWMQ